MTDNTLLLDGRKVTIEDDRNLLELIRRSGVDLPTFCYHSDLSVYGACRLCIVEIEGRGVQAACSTKPEPGMLVTSHSSQLREARKLTIELLLANHDRECPSCARSSDCSLQDLAQRLGVETVRYDQKTKEEMLPLDRSSPSLVRDTNKCVLCGDCVRVCSEVQNIGALDFTDRGASARVGPAFDLGLGNSECVSCGQCAAVCPTGAIVPADEQDEVWELLHNPDVYTVAQVAPAVRVALGEFFGMEPGSIVTGQMVTALKMIGFDQVYDTSFGADMTILEEGNELLERVGNGGPFPLFTSCCPAWVRWAENAAPELSDKLSSCKSPQQMFGAVIKEYLPDTNSAQGKKVAVISIMPCTAKKSEARLPQHKRAGVPDVDNVLTTQELGRMLQSLGIRFPELEPAPFDLPLGFASGAGVLFGASGGVTEAALRYVAEKVTGEIFSDVEFHAVRGLQGLKEATVTIGDLDVRIAVVQGLGKAQELVQRIQSGEAEYHFVEVMACPGGCIAGAGQPISKDRDIRQRRSAGIYTAERGMPLQKSQDNHLLHQCYEDLIGDIGGHVAHDLLHTHYEDRSAIYHQPERVRQPTAEHTVRVSIDSGADRSATEQALSEIQDFCDDHSEGGRVAIERRMRPAAHSCSGCSGCGSCNSSLNIQVGRQQHSDTTSAREALAEALQQ